MDEKKYTPEAEQPVSEADLLENADVDVAEDTVSYREKNAEELGEDEIITFGVNDDKRKKPKFLEDKIDASTPELSADNYDIHIPTPQPADADARIAGKTPIRVFYDMNGAEVAEGLKRFHKLTMYPKNLVYSIILFVIFILYVYRIVTADGGSQGSMQYFLAVLCVALIAFLWYMPHRHIKATVEAVEKERNTFMVDVYDTCMMVGEADNQMMVDYAMPKPRVIAFETPLVFGIGIGKEKVFLLPKRCLEGNEQAVRACLQTGFQDKFKSYPA